MSIAFDFPGKEADERVVLLLRRHPYILFRQTLLFLFYFALPVGIYILAKLWLTFILSFPVYPVFILLVSVYYSFFLLFLLIEWIDYYFDVWLVTNKRLIDVDQIGLLKRIIAEMRLDKIQDVTMEVSGIFGTLFHFGNVRIQTAAETQRFEIKQVYNPAGIRTEILNLYDEYTKYLDTRKHSQPISTNMTSSVTPGVPSVMTSPSANSASNNHVAAPGPANSEDADKFSISDH